MERIQNRINMKMLLLFISTLLFLGCSAQNKIDLNNVKFDEDIKAFVKSVPEIHVGNLFTTTNMLSYGVSKNTVYYFRDFLPNHVELLSYNGQLAGFAFKMKTFDDMQKVEEYLRGKYKLAFHEKMTAEVTSWQYADDKVIVHFRSIPKEAFDKGMTGYLTVFRADFSEEYERLMKL